MELVYLWVEDYKNIKKQGFNFSPRFDCSYDGKDVTIKDKKNIENFFGKNTNITAIVGSNGSGKSSILELIAKIINKEIEDINYIILFNINNEMEYLSNLPNSFTIKECRLNNKFYVYNSNNITNGYFDSKLDDFSSANYSNYKESNIRNQSIRNFFLNSNRILEAYSIDSLQYRNQHALYINEISEVFDNSKLLMQFDFINKFNEKSLPFSFPKEIEVSIQHNKNTSSFHKKGFSETIADVIKDFHYNVTIDEYEAKDKYIFTEDEQQFLTTLQKYRTVERYESICIPLLEAKVFIEQYLRVNIKLLDLKWHGLSSGEESLLNLFTLSLHGIEGFRNGEIKEDIFVIMAFDEIENNLHPQWQKTLVKKTISFFTYLQHYYKETFDFNLHLQLLNATHSPFILSDLPKENIIFLKDGKQIDALEKKQTFGANIHTLLSDGFFMDGGLMGEFAKGKIDDVIDLLNSQGKLEDKELKLCKDVVSIIGEPILKKQLQRMLNNKLELSNKDEIDILKEEMDLLKHRMEILRKNQ